MENSSNRFLTPIFNYLVYFFTGDGTYFRWASFTRPLEGLDCFFLPIDSFQPSNSGGCKSTFSIERVARAHGIPKMLLVFNCFKWKEDRKSEIYPIDINSIASEENLKWKRIWVFKKGGVCWWIFSKFPRERASFSSKLNDNCFQRNRFQTKRKL